MPEIIDTNPVFAEIIIPLALPKNYTWSVPGHLLQQIKPGIRVEVNLGKNKKYAGIVKLLHNQKPIGFEPKDILAILDTEPIVLDKQLQLWEWLAQYYMCTEGEVMAAALPAHFKLSSETIVVFNEEYGDDFAALNHDEYLIAEALLLKRELKLSEVQQVLDMVHVYPVISALIQKNVCYVWESMQETYKAKKELYVLLNAAYDNDEAIENLLNEDKKLQRAGKQMELLLSYIHLLKTTGEVTKQALLKKSNASDAQLKGLVEKNILRLEKRVVDRLQYLPRDMKINVELSSAQQSALEAIQKLLVDKSATLLHGITSSGKTLVYVKLIEEQIRAGKQVLYLLPEIALTSQLIRRLQKFFGGYIGIYHSKFSQNERVEIWKKVKSGELKIVIGARSSIFLPFNDLSLIICDEEHDSSFKQQEPAPRYHGRDAAIFLATLFGAKTVLGSATPSIETYQNALSGKYGLTELLVRYNDMELPKIEIIDTSKIEQKDKSRIMIAPHLKDCIENTVAENKQVILFQNRRGYDPYRVCETCGWIPKCKHCDVSLTFHKIKNKLVCHYCGTNYPMVNTCMACGNHQFAQRNFGTEKIEEQLQELFPQLNIARMDVDTVRGKNAHDTLIQQFEQHRIDILVGTQMVVKGLDFDNVGLVAIVDADALLHFADFRVNERAFQLMEQVSGRAGRKPDKKTKSLATGKVLVQTVQPTHPVLQYVEQHDYKQMVNAELESRKQFFYPPFSRLIQLTFKHKMKETATAAAHEFAGLLQQKYAKHMVGPAEPVINRIRNQYLMEMLLKLPKDSQLIQDCKADLLKAIAQLKQNNRFKAVVIIPDVDIV